VPDDEEVVAFRGGSIFSRVDFFIGAVYTNAEHTHEHATSVRDVGHRRLIEVGKMQ
jgi:hypothetical protein